MLEVSDRYIWFAAQVLHPVLWAACASGKLPEHIVEDNIGWSCSQVRDMINYAD